MINQIPDARNTLPATNMVPWMAPLFVENDLSRGQDVHFHHEDVGERVRSHVLTATWIVRLPHVILEPHVIWEGWFRHD